MTYIDATLPPRPYSAIDNGETTSVVSSLLKNAYNPRVTRQMFTALFNGSYLVNIALVIPSPTSHDIASVPRWYFSVSGLFANEIETEQGVLERGFVDCNTRFLDVLAIAIDVVRRRLNNVYVTHALTTYFKSLADAKGQALNDFVALVNSRGGSEQFLSEVSKGGSEYSTQVLSGANIDKMEASIWFNYCLDGSQQGVIDLLNNIVASE